MVEPPDVVNLQTGYGGFVLLDERFLLVRFLGDVVVTGDEDYDRSEDFVGDVIHGLQLGIRHGVKLNMGHSHETMIENDLQVSIRGETVYMLRKPERGWGKTVTQRVDCHQSILLPLCEKKRDFWGSFEASGRMQ